MAQQPEYAPQYSFRERVRYAIFAVLCAGAVIAIFEWWLLPEWAEFAKSAHCRTLFGIPGTAVVMYGTFVGLPLVAGLTIGPFIVPSSLRCIRARHYPEPGKKVLGRIKVRTGRAAIVRAGADLAMLATLFALAIWGGFAATDILRYVKPRDQRICAAQTATHTGEVPLPTRAPEG